MFSSSINHLVRTFRSRSVPTEEAFCPEVVLKDGQSAKGEDLCTMLTRE